MQKVCSYGSFDVFQSRVHQDANSYAKKRYYHHSMTDPFLALLRDNELLKDKSSQKEEEVSGIVNFGLSASLISV